ncbi:hypothetical protein BFP97_06975 [Roseivirga sp. 4D4]|uniref:T9SS type A sorting domain-containing protein n=1 Tax=Roseivirga sp. 4D4 TaxID=1889784 RepID=UPI000853B8A5|nr:T9SS type A sorting domain-containing protein [Roseivirga sp. 4D4]OEK01269.1 hypothetical protein BFP97_06975 [Roseivirga sp. 4D4]
MKNIYIIRVIYMILLVCTTQSLMGQNYFNWGISLGNVNENEVSDLAVDDSENVYIIGTLEGTIDMNPTTATNNVSPVGGKAVYLTKYDKNGVFQWSTVIEAESGTDLALNGSGSIIVTGTLIGSATIGSITLTNTESNTATASFIAGFDTSNGSYQGGRVIEGTGVQETFDIKAKDGFIYLAGSFTNTINLGSALSAGESTQRGNAKDFFIARFNNTGGIDWAKTVATNGGANRIEEIELDNDGGLYLGGILRENLNFDTGINLSAAFDPINKGFITKLDTAGSLKWFRRTRRTDLPGSLFSPSTINSIEIDSHGNVSGVGHVTFDVRMDPFSSILNTQNSTTDIFIVKFTSNGSPISMNHIGAPGTLTGVRHAVDDNDNYIIIGNGQDSNNDFDLGSDTHSVSFSSAERDIFVAKYDSLLNFQWADGFIGNSLLDRAEGLAEKNGNIYVAGYHEGGIDVEFGPGNTVLSTQGGRDMFVASINSVSVFNQEINLCDGQSVQVGGNSYNQIGTYQDLFTAGSVSGNDSIVNTNIMSILPPITLTVSTTDNLCNGESNGSATVVASDNNTRNYTYSIDGSAFQTSPTFDNLSAGNYTIIAKDSDSCSANINLTINEPSPFSGAPSVIDNVCSDGTSGQITINVTGGTGTLMYSIDGTNFQASNVFDNLATGDYDITVKDANDCTVSGQVTVGAPTALTLLEDTKIDPKCMGSSDGLIDVFATGGTGPYTYSIDGTNFSNSNTFGSLNSGDYSVTVKDANNCTSTLQITLTDPSPLVIVQSAITPIDCNGASTGGITIQGQGGTPGYQYAINGGSLQSSGAFTGLAAGTHTFTIQDANGCTHTADITLSEPAPFSISSTITPITCNGDANGVITIDQVQGGTSPYQYSIDGTNFQNPASFGSLSPGDYTITIMDANGCTTTRDFSITEPPLFSGSVQTVTDVTCHGESNGAIIVNASGGWSGVTYSIDGTNFQSSGSFTNLVAGSYTIVAMDQFGCSIQLNATVNQPTPLQVQFEQVDVSCNGASDGQIAGIGSGGTAPYSYSLDGTNFQTTVFQGLSPGSYTLTLKDANECIETTTVNITEPNILTTSFSTTNAICHNEANGTITLTSMGGTSPYQYSLDGSSFQSSPEFTMLAARSYSVITRDANNCTITTAITVSQPDALVVSASLLDDNTISASATGGTGPYEYSLDGLVFQTSGTFSGLANGNYTVTVRDANACVSTIDQSLIVTSVNEPVQSVIVRIYPNPAKDLIQIKDVQKGDRITIADVNRQISERFQVNKSDEPFMIDISAFNEGVFILRIESGNGKPSVFKKFIKKY